MPFIVSGLGILALIGLGWLFYHYKPSSGPSLAQERALQRPAIENARLLARCIRLIQRELDDPMYAQSSDWARKATKIVEEYNQEGDWN